MNGPTVDQLLILADRAERGRLTPAEAAALRVGIQLAAEQRRKDAATIGGLQNRIRTLKGQARLVTPRQILRGAERIETARELRTQYEDGATIQALANQTGHSYYRTRDLLLAVGTVMRPRGRQNTTSTRKDTT
jgi:hypothetical protein